MDRVRGRVTALDLTQLGLNGRIPPEVGRLDGLVSLRLSRNRLVGPIPPELGGLSNLRKLWLDDNRLSGPVPPELGRLSRLADLRVKENLLSGPLPPSVAALPGLETVRFAGDESVDRGSRRGGRRKPALPDSVSAPVQRLLHASGSARQAGRRRGIEFGVTRSPSTIGVESPWWVPSAVAGAAVQGPRIVALDLSHMGLNGHIPADLSALDELAVLHLGDNRLGGPIPPELGALAGLRVLTLENNALTGTIPEELGALRQLVWLHLGGNELAGPIPQQIATPGRPAGAVPGRQRADGSLP